MSPFTASGPSLRGTALLRLGLRSGIRAEQKKRRGALHRQ